MLTKIRKEKIGIACIIISAVLFGVMPLLAKTAYHYGANAYSVAFGRFFIGSILLWIIIQSIPNCSLRLTRAQFMQLFRLSLFYGLMPILLYKSYEYIDSGLSTTLHFTYPVAVILILVIFCRKKIKVREIVCTVVCMFGGMLLYNPNGEMNITGIILAVSSGIVYAIYIVLLGQGELRDS